MRKLAWWLLLGLVFSIPWEYSLDLGPPLGNIARILSAVLLLAMVPAVLQDRGMRGLHPLHWLVLALLAWFAASYFWSIDQEATLIQIRGYVQETVIAWFVWELTDSPEELRSLLRCYVAGSWVLAALTLANFASPETADQVRFVAGGQDPNDVARFLDFGFPLGALLIQGESRWGDKVLALGFMPIGLVGVLLTASRSGVIAAAVALCGCGIMLAHKRAGKLIGLTLPVVLGAFWMVAPRGTIERILTINEALTGGDLNHRLNIWAAGWQAFARSPFAGSGAGTFVSAAHLAPGVTAHNTALGIAVEGGVAALLVATAILAIVAATVHNLPRSMRLGLGTVFLVWLVNALVLSLQTNRATWLLLGMIVVAGRLASDEPEETAMAFPQRLVGSLRGTVAAATE